MAVGAIRTGVLMGCVASLASCSAAPARSAVVAPASADASPGGGTAVRLLWTRFFNSATPIAQREGLLQNGPDFKDVLVAQASDELSATVSNVEFHDASHAVVSFSLRAGSTVRLPSIAGEAVFSNGRWLVSKSTMCVVSAASGQRVSVCSS